MSMIHSQQAAPPVGQFPHARRAGNLLFVSGIGPRERGTSTIPGASYGARGEITAYDFASQFHAVFRNVRQVLAEVGRDLDSLVDVTVFLTDMQRDFALYNGLWAELFGEASPCRTTVEVTRLPTPIAIEVKCIATL